jgi:hypothetical protein
MYATAGARWLRPLGVAVLLLAAAACSDDPPQAGAVKTPTPSAQSSTPTPTETPVEQQVEAAVRAYYAELTRAAQTNDTSTLKTMVAVGCPCYRAIRVIDGDRKRGETTPDAIFQLVSVQVHDVIASSASAETRTRDSAYRVLDRTGAVIDRIDAARTHLDLALIRNADGQWKVTNLFDLESSG